ncbi:MAG: hypothetical protein JWO36_7247 [Myxococcales bacterium]|nr:hypothetical protein [Myxococcales bacterium]
MRPVVALGVAVLALAGARVARVAATEERKLTTVDEPYAPSPAAAPFLSLGYRELAADLVWVRLSGYFGGSNTTARGLSALVDALIAFDPKLHRGYEYGARATTMATHDVDQSTYLHAISVLERGMAEFPDDWRLPYLAGQIYTQDLVTQDASQRRAWDERGTLLIESAIRKPGAPAAAAEWAAVMRTKLGQHEHAVQGLREMLLVTNDEQARKALIERLAKLEGADSTELAAELLEARHKFTDRWLRERPTVPPSMYVLIRGRMTPGFDLGDLATGGRDLIGTTDVQKLEPIE